MSLLFLDFYGVLHPKHCHESKRFCCLEVFEQAVRQAPDIDLVVTSTWRLQNSLEQLRKRFSIDVAARIAGGHATVCRPEGCACYFSDVREKHSKEVDDLRLKVTVGIGWLPRARQERLCQIGSEVWHRGRTRSAQRFGQHRLICPEC